MIRLSVPNISDEEIKAVCDVLRSGQLVHGEECERFEQELAAYLGCAEVVLVSSGTAALHLALVAAGVGPGDAVIVPDFTFPATANVVELVGARPIFVDVDIHTYNLTAETLQETISSWRGPEKIKAVMPVHEFGCPADMTGIMTVANENGIQVIEDAACAFGAVHNGKKVGTFGKMGCFSFHPRKTLTTGEGGAISTNDEQLAQRLRLLRSHGMLRSSQGVEFVLPGYNYRLTNFQAAMGRSQLRKFDGWLKQRQFLSQAYDSAFSGINEIRCPMAISGHSWQTYMIVIPEHLSRNQAIAKLRDAGIETNLGAQSVSSQPYFRERYGFVNKEWNSVRLFNQGLALPFCESMTTDQVSDIVSIVKNTLPVSAL